MGRGQPRQPSHGEYGEWVKRMFEARNLISLNSESISS